MARKKKKEERDCLRLKEASESYQLDPHVKFASCFATN
jgi:hypothetical protein